MMCCQDVRRVENMLICRDEFERVEDSEKVGKSKIETSEREVRCFTSFRSKPCTCRSSLHYHVPIPSDQIRSLNDSLDFPKQRNFYVKVVTYFVHGIDIVYSPILDFRNIGSAVDPNLWIKPLPSSLCISLSLSINCETKLSISLD